MAGKVMVQYADRYNEELLVVAYETIRKSGVCSMFDMCQVKQAAKRFGMKELAKFIEKEDREGYKQLLFNLVTLFIKYEIKQ